MGARVLEFLFWEGASGATSELVMRGASLVLTNYSTTNYVAPTYYAYSYLLSSPPATWPTMKDGKEPD